MKKQAQQAISLIDLYSSWILSKEQLIERYRKLKNYTINKK